MKKELRDVRTQSSSFAETTPEIRRCHIAEVVTDWTGIPVENILQDEEQRLLSLEERLSARVVGQREAVSTVARSIRRGRLGLKSPHRPTGSFIFVGKTGVGKTELSVAIAEEIFGSPKALIRLDMSEYMEKHSVARLIGSPPGYVGYEDGGQLTERIRRCPYSVVLFDEIEKAHPDVFNILLQILEDGRLTDSQGRCADFRNSIIIMTSNLGADTTHSTIGFTVGDENQKGETLRAVRSRFRPELLGRIDEIVFFRSLCREDIEQITDTMLSELTERAKALDISLSFDSSVLGFISESSYSEAEGARRIRRELTRLIEDPLSEEFLRGEVMRGNGVRATVENDRIVFCKL